MSRTQIKAEDLRVGDEVLACMTAEEWTVHPVDPPFVVKRVVAESPMVHAWEDSPDRRLDIQGFTPVYITPQENDERESWSDGVARRRASV